MKMNKRFAAGLSAVSALVLGVIGNANAAPAEAFTQAITTTTADIATYGAALVGVSAVGVGFMIGIKYIKKIRGAA